MTDFFAQLAVRHAGGADMLRPRVPFRFEPLARPAPPAAGTGPAGFAPAHEAEEELLPGHLSHPRAGRPMPLAVRSARGIAALDPPHGRTAGKYSAGAGDRAPAAPPGGPASRPRGSVPAGPTDETSAQPRGGGPVGSPGETPATEAPAAHSLPGAVVQRTPAGRSRAGALGDSYRAVSRPEQAAGTRLQGRYAGDGAVLAETSGVRGERESPGELWGDVAPPASGRSALALPSVQAAVAADQDQHVSPASASLTVRGEAPASTDARPELFIPTLLPVPPVAARLAGPAGAAAPRRRGVGNRIQQIPGDGGPAPDGGDPLTVQVTIGRVEVRAAAPAPHKHSQRLASTGPTLADYLRHRSRSAGEER